MHGATELLQPEERARLGGSRVPLGRACDCLSPRAQRPRSLTRQIKHINSNKRLKRNVKQAESHECDVVRDAMTSRERKLTLLPLRSRHWGGQQAPPPHSSSSWSSYRRATVRKLNKQRLKFLRVYGSWVKKKKTIQVRKLGKKRWRLKLASGGPTQNTGRGRG